MRRTVLAVLGLLLLALAPTPQAAAPEGACVPACTVVGAANSFTPRAVALTSGATVTWTTPEMADTLSHNAAPVGSYCFAVTWSPGGSGSARFDVVDGALRATVTKLGVETTKTCTDAIDVGGGAYVLQYECLFHPMMVGELVVVAAAG